MKLEEEIQQKEFKSPFQKLAINIIYTANWINTKYATFLKETDITQQQFNVLRILRGQHPNYCNLKLIKERMLDRMSDASRIIDKLLLKGLIQRNECPDDRRQINILISEKGLELLSSLDFIDEEIKVIFGNLNPEQIQLANDLLDKLRSGKENH